MFNLFNGCCFQPSAKSIASLVGRSQLLPNPSSSTKRRVRGKNTISQFQENYYYKPAFVFQALNHSQTPCRIQDERTRRSDNCMLTRSLSLSYISECNRQVCWSFFQQIYCFCFSLSTICILCWSRSVNTKEFCQRFPIFSTFTE